MTDTFIKQRWVHVRRSTPKGGKKLNVFTPISEAGGDLAPEEIAFEADRKQLTIGGVYEIEATEDRQRARTKTARFVEMWRDESAVNQWQAAARARDIVRRAEKGEALGRHTLERTLQPIREVYSRTPNAVKRIAIELAVLAYIRSTRILPGDHDS